MATFTGLTFYSSGIKSPSIGIGYRELPFRKHNGSVYRICEFKSNVALSSRRNPDLQVQYFRRPCSRKKNIFNAGRNYQLNYNDDYQPEPFWLNLTREAIWNVRSLVVFLAEQPSQLKYIEWPSFQSTLKTATLTLVLVAFLIVALSSVDSTLSFLLALYLRRKT